MNLENIIFENTERIPAGIKEFRNESQLYVLGLEYAERALSFSNEFNFDIKGIVAAPFDNASSSKYDNIIPLNSALETIENVSFIVSFKWIDSEKFLHTLCDDSRIKNIYILEGAQYSYEMMFRPEKKLFRHDKIRFVDSYYDGVFMRGLTYDYFKENYALFEQTYNWLADDISRNTMIAYLDGHINIRTFPMNSVKDKSPQYFAHDVIDLSDKEIYLDCGGWDGDTVNMFLKHTNGKYKKIIVFEPDKNMIPKLKENIASTVEYTLINKGAFNENKTIGFDNSVCGTITDDLSVGSIEVARIDDIVTDDITFIKMDIEGSELAALNGAKETLMRSKPKMAICVYHKREDLITIPQFIKELHNDYDLYLRAYFDYLSEVVLYAIPKNG